MTAWGADGCRAGWFFVGLDQGSATAGVVRGFTELVERTSPGDPIFVDIPIGLPGPKHGGRACDVEARRMLSPLRGSSVFPAPSRSAVYAGSYEEASRLNREALGKGLSRQSWALVPKIREIDQILRERPSLSGRMREVHPEVCFAALKGAPMEHSKKTRAGFNERMAVLGEHLPDAEDIFTSAFLEHGGFGADRDDIVDAMVAAVTAMHADGCRSIPGQPQRDEQGLAMEIVYWEGLRRTGDPGAD